PSKPSFTLALRQLCTKCAPKRVFEGVRLAATSGFSASCGTRGTGTAERGGFEPPRAVYPPCRFSKPVHSTTLPSLRMFVIVTTSELSATPHISARCTPCCTNRLGIDRFRCLTIPSHAAQSAAGFRLAGPAEH